MHSISTPRLYLLRAMYLLLAAGLGLSIWPSILFPPEATADSKTVVRALLGAIGLLALLGLRAPLRMLPLLLFELVWKAIWLLAFALPLWRQGSLDANVTQNVYECLAGVALVLVVTPWDYVFRHYVRESGESRRGVTGDRTAPGDA